MTIPRVGRYEKRTEKVLSLLAPLVLEAGPLVAAPPARGDKDGEGDAGNVRPAEEGLV